ncbi:MAG: hypothetical protein NUV67_03555 [archaeon]|nr:hypothetical protein [archaeon]
MRIALLTSLQSEENILPLVASRLREKIVNVEVQMHVANSNLALVGDISKYSGRELVVVALFYSEETHDVRSVMDAIIFASGSGANVLSFVEKIVEFEAPREAERISESVFTRLFGSKPKKPQRETGSISEL